MAHPILQFTNITVTVATSNPTTATKDNQSQPALPSQVEPDTLDPTDLLAWDETPDPAATLPAMMADFNWSDPDATLCVICQTDVSRTTDLLWVATDCGVPKHAHLYHADCPNMWWCSNDAQSYPRCTKCYVSRFLVHARLPNSRVAWQAMQEVPKTYEICPLSGEVTMIEPLGWMDVASSHMLYETPKKKRANEQTVNAMTSSWTVTVSGDASFFWSRVERSWPARGALLIDELLDDAVMGWMSAVADGDAEQELVNGCCCLEEWLTAGNDTGGRDDRHVEAQGKSSALHFRPTSRGLSNDLGLEYGLLPG